MIRQTNQWQVVVTKIPWVSRNKLTRRHFTIGQICGLHQRRIPQRNQLDRSNDQADNEDGDREQFFNRGQRKWAIGAHWRLLRCLVYRAPIAAGRKASRQQTLPATWRRVEQHPPGGRDRKST